MNRSIAALFCLWILATVPRQATAEPSELSSSHKTIQVGHSIGDGKNGRIYSQWQELVENRPVESIRIRVQKRSGANDAYISLRFGNGEQFDNTRKVFLTNAAAQTLTWDVNGASSANAPLILSAYNCEVDVIEAQIDFSASVSEPEMAQPRADQSIQPKNGDWVRGGNGWGGGENPDDSNDDVHWDEKPGYPPGGYGGRGDRSAGARCHKMTIQSPRIDVSRIQAIGSLFAGHFKVEGSVAGLCVEEAGYYEKGKLKERIQFPLSDQYKRLDFNVRVRTGERGEIRVFTSDGLDQTISVDEAVRKTMPF